MPRPELFDSAWWEIRDDEDEDKPCPYWFGYCEGDKDGDRMADGQPLTMFPDHFPVGTRVNVKEPETPGFYERLYDRRGIRVLSLELDEADWNVIQSELAHRQARSRWPDGGTVLPEGSSNLAGAMVAEIVRDLLEYRELFERETPP